MVTGARGSHVMGHMMSADMPCDMAAHLDMATILPKRTGQTCASQACQQTGNQAIGKFSQYG